MAPLRRPLGWFALLLGMVVFRAEAQTTVSVPLTTGESGKISIGSFSGGTLLQISVAGTGDLVDSRLQVNPDGSLAAVAASPYGFANPGASYPSVSGFPSGDGVNHFSGGGLNYDFGGNSGWMFAGTQTTDTTDPTAIRAGALVGTFVTNPARTDWFFIGYGGNFTVPTGGATLYLAVNESYSPDNHGNYSITFAAVPEPSVVALLATGIVALGASRRRRVG